MNPAPNVFLVGPMGAGKSTIGRRLARHFGLAFIDLDDELEARTGASVKLIFELEGEAGFRARESALLASEAEPVVERVLASAAAMFEAGESDVTDLLETLRGVLGGQIAALDSYGAALRAHRELEVAAGRPLPLTEGDE